MLFATGTPRFSVPALTGAIMCMGVATANSVLVISFARERLAAAAATRAPRPRSMPVSSASVPVHHDGAGDDHRHGCRWHFGMGEGGEQNAPLGRAVIGGLIFATIATLIFVPVVFSLVHRNHGKTAASANAAVPGAPHVA
jgi:multidrug efflux pump subunit AcrB